MEPFEASIVLRSRPPHKLQSVLHADGDLTEGRSCGETIANNTTRLLSPPSISVVRRDVATVAA